MVLKFKKYLLVKLIPLLIIRIMSIINRVTDYISTVPHAFGKCLFKL